MCTHLLCFCEGICGESSLYMTKITEGTNSEVLLRKEVNQFVLYLTSQGVLKLRNRKNKLFGVSVSYTCKTLITSDITRLHYIQIEILFFVWIIFLYIDKSTFLKNIMRL